MKGNVRKLTDLKGKVVLLDFSVFQSPAGSPHNLMLRCVEETGIVPLDSVKLKGEGTFSFKQPRPESPEFCRQSASDKIRVIRDEAA